eukprot:TRINITY_DN36153_c0_g1_i1.p1 TRINITY_DN36153_c0_g1~~TRINITY_DN36153_c0_g1_i1.p1  ORF type:complete len:653 (+),score=262.17 TRINITY_DN36153_c0_g1_i1:73-2031(+)
MADGHFADGPGHGHGMHALEPEELARQIDRILKATNPNLGGTGGEHKEHCFSHKKEDRCYKPVPTIDHTAFHFVMHGNAIKKEDEEARQQIREKEAQMEAMRKAEEAEKNPELIESNQEDAGRKTKILKNRFNFTDRASQTFNNPMRDRQVMTEPPPIITFSSTASQWDIYDAYKEDQEQQQKAAGKGKGKGKDGEKKRDEIHSTEQDENILNSPQMLLSLKIMERMVNQNSCHDITDDYKYWDDMGDPYKPESGTLLPLWKFQSDKAKRKTVTSICWNPRYNDLFAVGYGSYEFLKQGTGMIHCWSLKNWSFPEYTFTTESGVMCVDFHHQHASLLACGLYDGTVLVFDIRQKNNKPIYQSTVKTGKHTDPVWQVYWSKEEGNKQLSFYSVSSDGRVTQWILSKNELQHANVTELKITEGISGDKEDLDASLAGLSGGTCFDFQGTDFIVGTEEGKIRKCSTAYNSQDAESYDGHYMSVYSVQWNKRNENVFLSASADWTVKLWEKSSKKPLMSFDLSSPVGEAAWAPFSSTVFAAVTTDGHVHVYDLNKNKHEPMCDQLVVKKAKLTRISFNPKEPIILVGDDRGMVSSLKLSPNLRGGPVEAPDAVPAGKKGKEAAPSKEQLMQAEVEKLNRIIEVVRKDRQLLEKQMT